MTAKPHVYCADCDSFRPPGKRAAECDGRCMTGPKLAPALDRVRAATEAKLGDLDAAIAFADKLERDELYECDGPWADGWDERCGDNQGVLHAKD